MCNTTDMIYAVDMLAHLISPSVDISRTLNNEKKTFCIVRSQLSSILFDKLIRARGTCQSSRGGGFG